MERTKFETFAGFAIRAGKLVRGTNAIKACKKRIYSIFLCGTASENTKKEAISLAKRFKVPLFQTINLNLADVVHKENCKLIAFLDKNLSDATINSSNEYFKPVNTIGGVDFEHNERN